MQKKRVAHLGAISAMSSLTAFLLIIHMPLIVFNGKINKDGGKLF